MSKANKSLANETRTTFLVSEDFAAKPKIYTIKSKIGLGNGDYELITM